MKRIIRAGFLLTNISLQLQATDTINPAFSLTPPAPDRLSQILYTATAKNNPIALLADIEQELFARGLYEAAEICKTVREKLCSPANTVPHN